MADNQNEERKNTTDTGTPGTYSANPQAEVGAKASEAGKRAQEAVDEGVQRGREYYERAAERGREALHEAQERGRSYMDEGRRRGERYYEEARERAEDYRQRADDYREKAERYYEDAADWARHQYDYASDWTHDRYDDALHYGREGYRATTRMAQENPLLVGVVALAAGIFVGAMLPRTSREDRTMGPYADDLRRRGARYARDYSRHAFSEDDSHPIHESEWRRRRDEASEAASRSGPNTRR